LNNIYDENMSFGYCSVLERDPLDTCQKVS